MPDIHDTVGLSGDGQTGYDSEEELQTALDSDDSIRIDQVEHPAAVRPGGNIPLSIQVSHDMAVFTAADPDVRLGFVRFQTQNIIDLQFDVSQGQLHLGSGEVSWPADQVSDRTTFGVDVTAPNQEGTIQNLTIEMRGDGSGNLIDTFRAGPIEVDPNAGEVPCSERSGYRIDPDTGNCVPIDGSDPGGDDGPGLAEIVAGTGVVVGTAGVGWYLLNRGE